MSEQENLPLQPKTAAMRGFLFVAPFVVLDVIVGKRIEPLFSFIRPGEHTSVVEYVLLFASLALLPVGAWVAMQPTLQVQIDKKRIFYLANTIIAVILVAVFGLLVVGLGSEIYHCDVLKAPNCD